MSPPIADTLNSPEVQAFASGFPVLVLHAIVSLFLLAGGGAIYALMSPWREAALIRGGNAAATVSFAGVVLGLAIPLAASLGASNGVKEILVWGLATLVIQLLTFRVVDVVLTGLPQRMQQDEISAAVLLAAAKVGTSLILAAALTG